MALNTSDCAPFSCVLEYNVIAKEVAQEVPGLRTAYCIAHRLIVALELTVKPYPGRRSAGWRSTTSGRTSRRSAKVRRTLVTDSQHACRLCFPLPSSSGRQRETGAPFCEDFPQAPASTGEGTLFPLPLADTPLSLPSADILHCRPLTFSLPSTVLQTGGRRELHLLRRPNQRAPLLQQEARTIRPAVRTRAQHGL